MVKQFTTAAALFAFLVVPALSQQTQEPNTGPAPPLGAPGAEAPALPPLAPVDLSTVTAKDLIGSSVVNANEENLGQIDDALFDADGKLQSVVVSFGGFLGFGTKTVQLPIDQVTVMSRGDNTYVVQTDLAPDALEAMPEYKKS